MSQDLLAEFGDFTLQENASTIHSQPSQKQHDLSQSNFPKAFQAQEPLRAEAQGQTPDLWDDEDDDDFGEFEEPEPTPSIHESAKTNADNEPPKQIKNSAPVSKSSGPPVIQKKATSASQLPSNHPFAGNADVLFDADDYDEFADADVVGTWGDEDDFGDFETSEPHVVNTRPSHPAAPSAPPTVHRQAAPAAASNTVDLLGLDDISESTKTPRAKAASSKPSKKPSTISRSPAKRPTAVPRQVSTFSNDAWDDFETQQPSTTSSQSDTLKQPPKSSPPKDAFGDLTARPSTTGVAPSNIPPPSILLTMVPPILASLSDQFAHSSTQKSKALSLEQNQTFLPSYITMTRVLGRIMAGRKSRWKRDKHLAQSMRIGPATSGRSGGMKLTGLDRTETSREDTEVEDVLRAWREQIGRLKSAVLGASADGIKLSVPELAATMPVRAAKGSEGAIVSTHACALCGLKREERVAKVDVDVEDSFGEWWIDGTNMHTSCARFWEVFKNRLMSR